MKDVGSQDQVGVECVGLCLYSITASWKLFLKRGGGGEGEKEGGKKKENRKNEDSEWQSDLEDISFKDLRALEGLRIPHPKPFSSLGTEALSQLDLQFQELVLAFGNYILGRGVW